MIKHYTINFYGQGKVNKNQMQSVYIRYLYTENRKKYTMNFETGYQLTKGQIVLLKSNQLGTVIQENLIKQKATLIQTVEMLNLKNNNYPDRQTLKEYFNKTVNIHSIDHYLNMFLQQLKCKQSSKDIYGINLGRFIKHIKLNNKTLRAIVNRNFIDEYFKYSFNYIKGKPYNKSNSTIKNTTAIVVRFVNFIASEINAPKIEYSNKIKEVSNKLHLTEEQLTKMLNFNIESAELWKNRKKSLQHCQNLTKLNAVIGLRINELLGIRKELITDAIEYIKIEFVDFKTTQPRAVIIKDNQAMSIVRQYNTGNELPFNVMEYKHYSNMLKELAKLAGLTQPVTLYSIKAGNKDTYNTKPLYKHISSHCIRRYAINKNLQKYGILVAKQYSGHKDFTMIQKHYSRNLNEQELLKAIS